MANLEVDLVYFYPKENAELHRTDRFELVHDEAPVPILRRGQTFTVAIRFAQGRNFQEGVDLVRVAFSFGKSRIFIIINLPFHYYYLQIFNYN